MSAITSVECAAVARGRVAPSPAAGRERAAVDDHPVAADRQFHRQRAGMGIAVDARRRRRAAIDDQHAAAGLQPLKAAVAQRRWPAPAAARLRQHEVDQAAALFLAAVEQRQAAVAMAQHPQGRAPCARSRWSATAGGCACAACSRARISVRSCKRGEMRRRAALGVAAVGQHLAGDLLRQEAQRAGQEGGVLGQRHGGGDQAFQRGQRAGIQFLGRQRGGQAARVGDQAAPSAAGGTRRRRRRRRSRNGRARR